MRTIVLNGWAACPELWENSHFPRERLFSYIDQMDGLPEAELSRHGDAVLVGFSMGGSTALRMLLDRPDLVRGLVLVSTTPCMMERKDEGWRGMSERRLAALRMGTILSAEGDGSPIFDERELDRGLEYLRTTDIRSRLVEYSKRVAAGELPRIPVAVMQSERDGIVRPANAEFLMSVFPHAELTMVPGGEHSLPATIPDTVAKAVAECCAEAVRLFGEGGVNEA